MFQKYPNAPFFSLFQIRWSFFTDNYTYVLIWFGTTDQKRSVTENKRCQEYFQHAMRFPLMNNNSVGKCFNGFGGSIDRENDAQKQQQLKRSTWIPIRSQIIDVPPECSPVWFEKIFHLRHSDSTYYLFWKITLVALSKREATIISLFFFDKGSTSFCQLRKRCCLNVAQSQGRENNQYL